MILGLTSDKYGPDKLYDEASTVIVQKLSQIQGVGQVSAGGGALPSVRVDANPTQLAAYGLTLSNLQSALSLQNSDLAKGQITDGIVTADIVANDQISHADDYKPLVVGYKNGAAVHLSDVAQVTDSVQNIRAGRLSERQARGDDHHLPPARRQHHQHSRPHTRATSVDRGFHSLRHGYHHRS